MSDKKNIDRLYQEKFKDFEPELPVDLWNKIEDGLPKKKKRRAIVWWYYGGLAAGLAVLFSLFYNNFNETAPQVDKQVVIQETGEGDDPVDDVVTGDAPETNKSPKNTNASITSNSKQNREDSIDQVNRKQEPKIPPQKYKASVASSNNNKSVDFNQSTDEDEYSSTTKVTSKKMATPLAVNLNEKAKNSGREKAVNKVVKNRNQETTTILPEASNERGDVAFTKKGIKLSKENKLLDESAQLENDAVAQVDSLPNKMVEDAMALQDSEKDSLDLQSKGYQKFKGSTLIAPVYSNSLAGSPLNENVADNSKSAGLNLSYGVALDYNISNRLSIRTGLHKIDMTYTTGDVRYMNTVVMGDDPFAGSFNAANVTNATVVNEPLSQMLAPGLLTNSFVGLSGELSQQLGYLEVPLELRYKLISSRLNLSVSGGMSALFLQENRVQLVGDNNRLELGSDDNFRNFNQSANFGIGLDYGLNDKLGVMIEPMFKYQLNALTNDPSGFSPYTIALYTGLTYKF
ncbi:MAG: outer membrane beta-barrel protein [Nonlabens sp.]